MSDAHGATVHHVPGRREFGPEAALPPGRSQPVADHRRRRRLLHRVRHHPRRAFRQLHPAGDRRADRAVHHVHLVARRDPRKPHARPAHALRPPRPALRHDAVHRQRGDVLRRLLLGLFQFPDLPGHPGQRPDRSGRRSTIHTLRSVPHPVPQHDDPAAVRLHRHLGAPLAAGERPQGPADRPGPDHHPGHLLHPGPGGGIFRTRRSSSSAAACIPRRSSSPPASTASTSSSAPAS